MRPPWFIIGRTAKPSTRRRPVNSALGIMNVPPRTSIALALIGSLVLLLTGFQSALAGAGPYASLAAVKVGIVVGVGSAYFFALWLVSLATARARGIPSRPRRLTVFVLLTFAGGLVTFLAPLLPSASLAAVCKAQVLCPEAANPILWSYLQLIRSLPILPFAVGVATAVSSAISACSPRSNA